MGAGGLEEQYYFHPDHLGSSNYITNIAGDLSQHMEYFAFGETFVEEHKNSINSPFKFNGKELDEESGLYYYGARYYDPRLSIWSSVDPLAYDGTYWDGKHNGGLYNNYNHGSYIYCYQNPVTFIDPNGKQTESGDITRGFKLQEVVIVAGKKSSFSWNSFGKGLVKGLVIGIVAAVVVVAVIATGGAILAAAGVVISASTVAALTTTATVVGSVMVTYSIGKASVEAITNKDIYSGESLSVEQTSDNLGNVVGNIAGGLAGGAAAQKIITALTPASVVGAEISTVAVEVETAASTAQKLQSVADDAVAKIGEGSGAVHGTKIHTEFGNNAEKIVGISKEISYLNGKVVKYGTKGSVRADAVEGNIAKPTAVYDLKTGSAKLTKANIAKYKKHLPEGTTINAIKPTK